MLKAVFLLSSNVLNYLKYSNCCVWQIGICKRIDKMQHNVEFWKVLDELVNNSEIIIDRPKETSHTKYPDFIYWVDYGYLKYTTFMDGTGIDPWICSKRQPIKLRPFRKLHSKDRKPIICAFRYSRFCLNAAWFQR